MEKALKEAYHKHRGNVSAIERELKGMAIPFSRKKIAHMLDFMGLERVKKPRKK